MAFYSHDNHDDIPYFYHIKMFQELENNDKVFILDLKTLKIISVPISDLEKTNDTETVYDYILNNHNETTYEFTSVSFSIDTVDYKVNVNIHFGTETNYLAHYNNIIICTTEREAKQLVQVINAKCEIQINQFKSIFHGAGWNYEPKHFRCG